MPGGWGGGGGEASGIVGIGVTTGRGFRGGRSQLQDTAFAAQVGSLHAMVTS
jgi:hypothetical protein